MQDAGTALAISADMGKKRRKPYRLSKPRERWSQEEHDKFLDGMKKFGRSWKRVEEYIGTKSAVQIRSHAQKFFSKLEKEGKPLEGNNSDLAVAAVAAAAHAAAYSVAAQIFQAAGKQVQSRYGQAGSNMPTASFPAVPGTGAASTPLPSTSLPDLLRNSSQTDVSPSHVTVHPQVVATDVSMDSSNMMSQRMQMIGNLSRLSMVQQAMGDAPPPGDGPLSQASLLRAVQQVITQIGGHPLEQSTSMMEEEAAQYLGQLAGGNLKRERSAPSLSGRQLQPSKQLGGNNGDVDERYQPSPTPQGPAPNSRSIAHSDEDASNQNFFNPSRSHPQTLPSPQPSILGPLSQRPTDPLPMNPPSLVPRKIRSKPRGFRQDAGSSTPATVAPPPAPPPVATRRPKKVQNEWMQHYQGKRTREEAAQNLVGMPTRSSVEPQSTTACDTDTAMDMSRGGAGPGAVSAAPGVVAPIRAQVVYGLSDAVSILSPIGGLGVEGGKGKVGGGEELGGWEKGLKKAQEGAGSDAEPPAATHPIDFPQDALPNTSTSTSTQLPFRQALETLRSQIDILLASEKSTPAQPTAASTTPPASTLATAPRRASGKLPSAGAPQNLETIQSVIMQLVTEMPKQAGGQPPQAAAPGEGFQPAGGTDVGPEFGGKLQEDAQEGDGERMAHVGEGGAALSGFQPLKRQKVDDGGRW